MIARRRAVDMVRSEVRRVVREDRSCRAAAAESLPSPSEEVMAPGGGTWDIAVGQSPSTPAAVTIVADAVGFCRLAANRVTPAGLDPHTGDQDSAAAVLAAAATLALD